MKITDIKIEVLPLKLHRPVVLTFGTIEKRESVVVIPGIGIEIDI